MRKKDESLDTGYHIPSMPDSLTLDDLSRIEYLYLRGFDARMIARGLELPLREVRPYLEIMAEARDEYRAWLISRYEAGHVSVAGLLLAGLAIAEVHRVTGLSHPRVAAVRSRLDWQAYRKGLLRVARGLFTEIPPVLYSND